jgi:hypoxanthine phosphoribosyltransferase
MAELDRETRHETLASEQEVDTRIRDMAALAIERYSKQDTLFVCFLKGGAPFAAKLMFNIAQLSAEVGEPYHPDLDYMTISTYGTGREAKEPRIVMDLAPDTRVQGRTVVMLDDVLDTGTTMDFAEDYLLNVHGAKTVESAVLVEKENERAVYQHGANIVGFTSPEKLWLTGMGMDDAKDGHEHNRWSGKIEIVNN